MFATKTYYCWCHVCGKRFSHQSEFVSGPTTVRDGETLLLMSHPEHEGELRRKAFAWYTKTGLPYSVAKGE